MSVCWYRWACPELGRGGWVLSNALESWLANSVFRGRAWLPRSRLTFLTCVVCRPSRRWRTEFYMNYVHFLHFSLNLSTSFINPLWNGVSMLLCCTSATPCNGPFINIMQYRRTRPQACTLLDTTLLVNTELCE